MNKVRYRMYHSEQDGYRHDKESTLFRFCPELPFRPLGLIIFGAGEALLISMKVGNDEQLAVGPIPADIMGPREFTIGQLELIVKTSSMQQILNAKGVPRIEMNTASPGSYLSAQVSEPVDIVCFWGIEPDNT